MAGEAPEVTKESIQSSDIDALARELYNRADPLGTWSAVDEVVRFYFRKEAARKLQAEHTRSRMFE